MFIELESSLKTTPQLFLKHKRSSGVIKKSQMRIYNEARALLMSIEDQLNEYQKLMEQRTVEMIEDKEDELNKHVNDLKASANKQLTLSKQAWFERAEEQLSALLSEQREIFDGIVEDVRKNIISSIHSRFNKMNQSESFIRYLTDALHAELDDVNKTLTVTHYFHELGSELTIENENSIVRIDTQELLHELRSCLENASND